VEALYRRYGAMVLRRCRSMLRDEERALDAMQEVFVQVLRRKDRLRADYPSSLLYRIATNTCLNALRAAKRRPTSGGQRLLDSLPDREEPQGRVLDACLLEKLFASELAGTRRMAEMCYLEGASLADAAGDREVDVPPKPGRAEAARRAGLSVSGVRKRLGGLRERGLALMAR
jgi:RNA polymerase sigma-70 factor (ECF subfamily)